MIAHMYVCGYVCFQHTSQITQCVNAQLLQHYLAFVVPVHQQVTFHMCVCVLSACFTNHTVSQGLNYYNILPGLHCASPSADRVSRCHEMRSTCALWTGAALIPARHAHCAYPQRLAECVCMCVFVCVCVWHVSCSTCALWVGVAQIPARHAHSASPQRSAECTRLCVYLYVCDACELFLITHSFKWHNKKKLCSTWMCAAQRETKRLSTVVSTSLNWKTVETHETGHQLSADQRNNTSSCRFSVHKYTHTHACFTSFIIRCLRMALRAMNTQVHMNFLPAL